MRITDLLKPEALAIGASASTRDEVIDQLVALHVAAGNVTDATAYKAGVLAREAEFSTAVGEGIAIPHAKVAAVAQAGLAAMTVPAGVDWNAPDEKPCDLVFMIAAPEGKNDLHLEMLAKLSALLMHEDFAAELRAAKTPEEFLAAIDAAEAARDEAEATREAAAAQPKAAASDWPEVLAITACPTGIAHTYMAAENLEKKAAELGVTLKEAAPVLRLLQQEGALVKVSEGLWYDAAAVEDLKKRTRAWFESHDDLTPGDFKEVTGGLTRKYLIPLLEYFDRERFTMRVGDRRQLRGRVS